MKKLVIAAFFAFPMFALAGLKPVPSCSDLPAAKVDLKNAKDVLQQDKDNAKTIVMNVYGKSPEDTMDRLVDDYQKCESLDLKALSGVGNEVLIKRILKVLPDKDAAARCYNSVMLHIDYAEHRHVDAGEFCLEDDTPTSKPQAQKFVRYFGGGSGGVLTTSANYFKCRSAMRAVGKSVDRVEEAHGAFRQDMIACEEDKRHREENNQQQPPAGQP